MVLKSEFKKPFLTKKMKNTKDEKQKNKRK